MSLYAWWIVVRPTLAGSKCYQLVINPIVISFVVSCLGEKYCSEPTITCAFLLCSLCSNFISEHERVMVDGEAWVLRVEVSMLQSQFCYLLTL